jgi:hypothetical protein
MTPISRITAAATIALVSRNSDWSGKSAPNFSLLSSVLAAGAVFLGVLQMPPVAGQVAAHAA